MKRLLLLCLTALLLPCLAQAVSLNETAVAASMDCSWQQGYQPAISGNTLTLCVPVDGPAKVTLTASGSYSPFKEETNSATARRDESSVYCATIKAALVKGRVNGDYPCTLQFAGEDGTAGEYAFVLHIRDGRAPEGDLRPVISDVSAQLNVGEDAVLTATLTNSNPYADLTGLTLRLTDGMGDVLPASTDTLLLADIPAGESRRVEIPLKVRANAAVMLHTLRFDLSWTALDMPGTWSESYTLPVNQTIRLEQGGVQVAATLLQGDLASLTLPVMNLGRSDLRNVLVTLDMPEEDIHQSVLVGELPSGETRQAKLTFTPNMEVLGLVEGTLTITAEDAYGNQASESVGFFTTIEEQPVTVVSAAATEEKAEETPWLTIGLGAGCATLLLGWMIHAAVLRGRIRRLEEDKL